MAKTKGQLEAAITAALSQFERDHLGRGPKQARTFILQDVILVRLTGILSPAEHQLSQETGGVGLIKQMRSRLIENASHTLAGLVEENVDAEVVSIHTDISTRTGERIFVFSLDRDLEATLPTS
ncbi:DUF2294 domain-containing protein [Persicimonas caeni]|jgi:uncharacterized protein YbcI|uniref:DUF2294 domain-containing protein n=1 Tax=Persicimonas caeni TaxID=2292766 RepID=A0A4Y6PS55_PERCE|nr:DUF2294 domain-containing protein [Persicimonas caeni]QDG50615.1 DUF2294 domain-containing protein [Persicimonas caeni]QED31836.1 DUF2294 domain-containing protein [Persicimonas caeni]